jgi:hypothetical protein
MFRVRPPIGECAACIRAGDFNREVEEVAEGIAAYSE